MNEYKVTMQAVVPGFLSDKRITEARVYKAESGEDAIEMAKTYIKNELAQKGISTYDLEESGASVNVIDVVKL